MWLPGLNDCLSAHPPQGPLSGRPRAQTPRPAWPAKPWAVGGLFFTPFLASVLRIPVGRTIPGPPCRASSFLAPGLALVF